MLIKAVSRLQQSSLCILPPYKRLLMHPFSSLKNKKWSQINWSESAQAAVFSTSIIKLIRSSEPAQKMDDESLRQKILNFKYKEGQFKLDEDVRNKVLQMFTTGIILNENVFRQQRVNIGQQINQTTDDLKRFIFCPNYLVTRQVFNVFIRSHVRKQSVYLLMTGGYGISKTISIILLIHLSNFINQFIFRAKQSKQIADQLELLRQKQFIIPKIPKIFYWSVDMKKLQFDVCDFVLQQFPQLNLAQRQTLKLLVNQKQKLQMYLNQIYPKDVRRILLVDQINSVASFARKYNEDAKRYNYDVNKIPQKTKDLDDRVYKALTQIDNLHAFADRVILNSSVNIQEELLKKSKSLKTIGLNFDGHDRIQIVKLPFQLTLKQQKWAKIDFWHYFWFEITRNFIEDKEVDQKLKQIQKDSIFLKTLQSSFNIKSYFRFLYIRQHLDQNNKLLLEINKSKSLQEIKKIIIKIAKSFECFCIVRHGKLLAEIMDKEGFEKQKLQYMLAFYRSAFQQKKQGADKFTVSSRRFYQFLSLQDGGRSKDSRKYQNILQNQQFLTFQLDKIREQIIFTLTPTEFIEICFSILFPQVNYYYPFDVYLDKNNKAFVGHAFETYFLLNFTNNTEIVMNFAKYAEDQSKQEQQIMKQVKNLKNQIKNLKNQESTSTIFLIANQQKICFTPLNQNTPSNKPQKQSTQQQQFIGSFQRNFEELFNKCKKQKNKYFAAFPKMQNDERFNRDYRGPSIDFAIAKFDGEHLMLYTFDTTVSILKGQSNLNAKQDSAKQLLSRLKNEGDNVIVQHTILAPIELKEIRKNIFKPTDKTWLSITYSDWRTLKINNKLDEIAEFKFNTLVELLRKDEQNYIQTMKKNNKSLNDEADQKSSQTKP